VNAGFGSLIYLGNPVDAVQACLERPKRRAGRSW
jgi:hypothetical protein